MRITKPEESRLHLLEHLMSFHRFPPNCCFPKMRKSFLSPNSVSFVALTTQEGTSGHLNYITYANKQQTEPSKFLKSSLPEGRKTKKEFLKNPGKQQDFLIQHLSQQKHTIIL